MSAAQPKSMPKVCVVTGTRAEYGLLYWTMKELQSRSDLGLQLIVTGAHTSKKFGYTIDEIVADGFKIDDVVEVLIDGDTRVATAKTTGLAMLSLAGSLRRLAPDIVLLLGDRYETFAAASSAFLMGIPIAHLCGGDISRGAFDDSLRHAISKFASLHFVTQPSHACRLAQLGEEEWRIHEIGDISAETILRSPLKSRGQVSEILGIESDDRYVMCTYHPTTARSEAATPDAEIIHNIFGALSRHYDADTKIIFTGTNADPANCALSALIREYQEKNPQIVRVFSSLGRLNYLSCLQFSELVLGNSSSGLLEAPVLGINTVNIGERQDGRSNSPSVFQANGDTQSILEAMESAGMKSKGPSQRSCSEHSLADFPSKMIASHISAQLENVKHRKNFVDFGGLRK